MLTTDAGAPLQNWAGNTTFRAQRMHRPASLDELRRIVASASRVRALGSGHSFNRIADTEHDLVRVDGLPRQMRVDERRGTVTVSGGMRYAEVAAALHADGHALANLASLPHISVAGSCATGTHGSGDGLRSLAAAVAAVQMVGPRGEVTALSREADSETFPGAVVGLGALGIVTELTLDIEPAFDVAQWVYDSVSLDRVADHFDDVFGAAYSVSAFTDWRSGHAVVWLKRRTDQHGTEHPGKHWQGGTLADGARHPIRGIPGARCTEQGGVPGPWHERLPHFRPDFTPSNGAELQSELFLPRAKAPEAIAALQGIDSVLAPVLQTCELRTVAADDLWLSPTHGRDSVTFHFTWTQDTDAVLRAIGAVEKQLMPLGARPHWGKLTTAGPADICALYEKAAAFGRLIRSHDPAGVFRNAFIERLFPSAARSVTRPVSRRS